MRSIFTKTLYDKRWALLGWSIAVIAVSVLLIAFYPSFGKDTQVLAQINQSVPPKLASLLGRNFGLGGDLANYLQGQMMNLNTPLMIIALGISLGVGLLASEEDRGTLVQLVVRPRSRARLLTEKWLAMVVISLIVMIILTLTTVLGGYFVDSPLVIRYSIEAFGMMWLLAMCFGTMAFMIGGLVPRKGLAIGLPAAWAGLSFFVYTLGLSVTSLEKLRVITWWYYYSNQQVIITGVDYKDALVLVVSILVMLIVGIWGFNRRDIA